MEADRSAPAEVTFRTKVDFWLIAVLTVALGGGIIAGVSVAAAADPGSWIPLTAIAGSILLIVVAAVPTNYTLSETHLLIRYGQFRRAVPFSSVLRVHRTRNPLSSPAWSLDRIAIHYRHEGRSGYVLISPVRLDEFLALLARRAGLQETTRGLVPTGPPA